MARKITTKHLADAINEHLDNLASLTLQARGVSVYPEAVSKSERSKSKLQKMLDQINMEAKDEISRRHSKKA